jgi:cell division septation protein DedD
MTRPKLVVIHPDQADNTRTSRDSKRYRFELSRGRLLLYFSGFIMALCWMFVLGILVGRGVALVSSEDVSIRGEFMRFLGLEKQMGQPAPKAAETWGDPKKMLESLNYYEDLTQKAGTPAIAPKPGTHDLTSPAPVTEPIKESAKESVAKRFSAPPPSQSQVPAEKPVLPEPEKLTKATPPPPASLSAEQFTLLVASLKDPENAQRLMDQLKEKGYTPKLEALDLNGGGRWNRVLVGSFQSREVALKFAAEFNKKESMEGLVIRDAN